MYGPDCRPMAEHHARHLDQFSAKEAIASFGSGAEDVSEKHSIAYLIVEEKDMIIVRDALRPARALVAEDQ